tara:strand:- start:131 stop:646 length:516 start_codon:yes stop_codon:yes gene_type:complete
MEIKDIYAVFETVAKAYDKIEGISYTKLWDLNGQPALKYPHILIECQPDYTTINARSGGSSNYLPIKKKYEIKVFLFDQWTLTERNSTKPEYLALQEKQSEMQLIFERYLSEVQRYFLDVQSANAFIENNQPKGFFGFFNKHNDKLVEIFEKITVVAPSQCTKGNFTYPAP